MACFLVPVAEAVVVTTAAVLLAKKEEREAVRFSKDGDSVGAEKKTTFSKKLKWLASLLWGGSFLLLFEHVWHGEIVPWFPFLTAMSNPADKAEMLHEMATVGVSMAIVITAVWVLLVAASAFLEKRTLKEAAQQS